MHIAPKKFKNSIKFLDKTTDVLNEHGWIKGYMVAEGAHCLLGAMWAASGGYRISSEYAAGQMLEGDRILSRAMLLCLDPGGINEGKYDDEDAELNLDKLIPEFNDSASSVKEIHSMIKRFKSVMPTVCQEMVDQKKSVVFRLVTKRAQGPMDDRFYKTSLFSWKQFLKRTKHNSKAKKVYPAEDYYTYNLICLAAKTTKKPKNFKSLPVVYIVPSARDAKVDGNTKKEKK